MSKRAKITAAVVGGVILLAVGAFAIFGRHSKVAESIKQQTAAILKKEYIPNQNVELEATMAFQKLDSLYDDFRQDFRMHYQTIATATFPDSSRLILIAEPAPFFEPDSLESICSRFTHQTSRRNFKIGYDGYVTDMAVVLGNATTENLDNIVAKLSRELYLSDYKPNTLDLLGKEKRHYFTDENLDYQITLGEFDDWFFAAGVALLSPRALARQGSRHKAAMRSGSFVAACPGETGIAGLTRDLKPASERITENVPRPPSPIVNNFSFLFRRPRREVRRKLLFFSHSTEKTRYFASLHLELSITIV